MKKHLKALLMAICATALVVSFACMICLFLDCIPTWLVVTIFFLTLLSLVVSFYRKFIKDDEDD